MRRADGAFVLEGVKLLEAALSARAPVEAVYFAPEAIASPSAARVLVAVQAAGVRTFALRRQVIERVADTTTPQPVMAVAGRVDVPLEAAVARATPFAPVVVCVDVRDPGNLGAIVRSAGAAGAAAVVACDSCADLYNPKTVRATAGALFGVPLVLERPAAEVLAELGRAGYRRVGAVARDGGDYAVMELPEHLALVLGNEAQGLDEATARLLDDSVTVPMPGVTESLNVAMAATVLLFDVARRRRSLAGRAP